MWISLSFTNHLVDTSATSPKASPRPAERRADLADFPARKRRPPGEVVGHLHRLEHRSLQADAYPPSAPSPKQRRGFDRSLRLELMTSAGRSLRAAAR